MPVKVFHTAEYRRRLAGATKAVEWFDPCNPEGQSARSQSDKEAQKDMVEFLNAHSNGIAIWDSSSPSKERRSNLVRAVSKR